MSKFSGVFLLLVFAIVWELAGRISTMANLPPVSEIAVQIGKHAPLLIASTIATAARALLGLSLALITGVGIGVWISMYRRADILMAPVIDFLRPLPSSALILVFALWFDLWKLPWIIVWFGCTWPILLNTRDRMRTLPTEVSEALDLLEMPTYRRFRDVYSRALLPGMLAGLRVSLGIAIILAITVELVIPPPTFFGIPHTAFGISTPEAAIPWGLGSYLMYYNSNFEVTPLYAGVLVAGFLGVTLNRAYHKIYLLILRKNHLLDQTSL